MRLTDGMKWTIIGTLCLIAFVVTVALIPHSSSRNQGEALSHAAESCPNGLAHLEFREGTSEIKQVVCK